MHLIKTIDDRLNQITMYRLLVYGLSILLIANIAFCLTGQLSQSAAGIALSIPVLVATCYVANKAIGILLDVPTNSESWLITALILCCILQPGTGVRHAALIALAGLVAVASKFVIVYQRKHLFNPAAFAALALGLTGLLPATWWIGNRPTVILMIIFGGLILRKIRRFQMFGSFLVASLLVTVLVASLRDASIMIAVRSLIVSSPLLFLGTVMLTEPETMPPRLPQQLIFGAIVGAILTSRLHVNSVISATPELALILGNVYSYAVSPKRKFKLRLVSQQQLAPHIYDFAFATDKPAKFFPGQYMEWTLGDVTFDRRGNRRTFSMASAPGDEQLHMAIKVADKGSRYKTTLLAMQPGDTMMAGQLAGNFILPKKTDQKLVFIAGGIGVTPFVSMVKDMINRQQRRDIIMFYLVPEVAEYCYQDVWQAAANYGLKVVPVLSSSAATPANWSGETGRLTPELLQRHVPDYTTRRFYLSGPNALVDNYRQLLLSQKIGASAIVVDHFSGY